MALYLRSNLTFNRPTRSPFYIVGGAADTILPGMNCPHFHLKKECLCVFSLYTQALDITFLPFVWILY